LFTKLKWRMLRVFFLPRNRICSHRKCLCCFVDRQYDSGKLNTFYVEATFTHWQTFTTLYITFYYYGWAIVIFVYLMSLKSALKRICLKFSEHVVRRSRHRSVDREFHKGHFPPTCNATQGKLRKYFYASPASQKTFRTFSVTQRSARPQTTAWFTCIFTLFFIATVIHKKAKAAALQQQSVCCSHAT